MTKILLMWLLFVPVPIINGILREQWYKKILGELGTNITGTLVLSSAFLIYTYLFFRNDINDFSNQQLLLMGLIWLILTLIFEFGMGLIAGRSWSYMLADYNLMKGRLWPLFLVVLFFSPFIIKFIVSKLH